MLLAISCATRWKMRSEPERLDPHRNARILRFERLGELFRDREVHRAVERDLALFARRRHELGRDRGRRRRLGAQRRG
jgi:hypothetical protein